MALLDSLAHRIQLEPSQVTLLRDSVSGKRVRYVLRYPSVLEYLLLQRICHHHGLPPPELHSRLHLRQRSTPELSYHLARRHRRRLIRELGTVARTSAQPAIFIPAKFFAGHGPRPLPKRLKFLPDLPFLPFGELWTLAVFLLYRSTVWLDLGPAISANSHTSGRSLLNAISLALYLKEKGARGATIHPRRTIARIVLSGPEFERILDREAIMGALTREEVQRRAIQVFREIAATMNRPLIALFRVALDPLFRRIFSSIDAKGIEALRAVADKHPVVLIPRHRSHLDYLLISYVLYNAGLPLPYIAAGNNLDVWPLGYFLRGTGGFFIRRKVENDPLYKVILNRYLRYLIKQGHLIEFFIEGGRSRTGTVGRPRFGLLKYVARAVNTGARRNLSFVPVGIGYERVAEDLSLSGELAGARKIRESLASLLSLATIHRLRLGSVTVYFGEPRSIRPADRTPSPNGNIDRLGYELSRDLIALSALSVRSIVAGAAYAADADRWERKRWLIAFDLAIGLVRRTVHNGDARCDLTRELKQVVDSAAPVECALGFLEGDWREILDARGNADTPLALQWPPLITFYKNAALPAFLPAIVRDCLGQVADREEVSQVLFRSFRRLFLLPDEWPAQMLSADHFHRSGLAMLLNPYVTLRRTLLDLALEHGCRDFLLAGEHLLDVLNSLPSLWKGEALSKLIVQEMIDSLPGAMQASSPEDGSYLVAIRPRDDLPAVYEAERKHLATVERVIAEAQGMLG